MPLASSENRSTKIARIQGQIYDELYSYGGLTNSQERGALVKELAREVKDVINQIESDLAVSQKLLLLSPAVVANDCLSRVPVEWEEIPCVSSTSKQIWFAIRPS